VSLIVGIRCAEGVVLAASGPATMPSQDGLPAARQLARKLHVVGGQAVLGVAGHDGLAQEMALSLERCLSEPDQRDSAEDVLRSRIREALAAPVQRTVAIHRTLQGLPGFAMTSNGYVVSQSLLALPFEGSLRLFEIDPECTVTEITPELAYACVGSGRSVAEPFLAFLRKVLWSDSRPGLDQSELAAFWTVLHSIEHNPGGLSHPIQIVVLTRGKGGSIEIVERGDDYMFGLRRTIAAGEEAVRRSFQALAPRVTESPAPPGPASAESSARKRVPEVRLTLDRRERRRGPGGWK
jgi:20S proteasome alpha/beta subunit